jgi:hypothetical protein
MDDFNFNLWYEAYDPGFTEININSLVPLKWLKYSEINHNRYSESLIKPINRYVEKLYPMPELVSIEGNTVRLRQKNHAEFFLLYKDGKFVNRDRPHIRQYYNTKAKYPESEDCFDPVYLFYAPWFIDSEVSVRFEQPANSPFEIYGFESQYKPISSNAEFVEPFFIPFRFKKVGSHMVSENYGRIKRQSPMFDIVLDLNDILIKKVEKFYEKD